MVTGRAGVGYRKSFSIVRARGIIRIMQKKQQSRGKNRKLKPKIKN